MPRSTPQLWDWEEQKGSRFQEGLLTWFAAHRRELPWRETTDPYAIWISEVMLQQTQVERVREFYLRFLAAFPTVQDLAAAGWEEVLEYWRGLGYYGRGRRLIETARAVVDRHGGRFPTDPALLRELPGIGPYTVGALLSFAHNLPHPALDTNGYRILSRVWGNAPVEDPKRQHRSWEELTLRLLPAGESRAFHSALMDLGSLVCLSRRPACPECPLRADCKAYRRGDEALTASSSNKKRVKTEGQDVFPNEQGVVEVAVAIIRDLEGRILVSCRRAGQHLAGLWEFPGGKRLPGESHRACLKREIAEELGVEIAVRPLWQSVIFAYPDRTVRLAFFRCSLLRGEAVGREGQEVRWVTRQELAELDMPPANREIVRQLIAGR